MKKFIYRSSYLLIAVVGFLCFSCEEYLDKTEKADITSETVFTDFDNYMGFVEVLYTGLVNWNQINRSLAYTFNFGDDEYFTRNNQMVTGDYMALVTHRPGPWAASERRIRDIGNTTGYQTPGLWWNGWNSIRIANIGLANLDLLTDATQEQRDLLSGLCYFFRANAHWNIMKSWGAIPYIDEVLLPDSDMKIPVLSFHETAQMVADDLDKAAELLPEDWDQTEVGSRTSGVNYGRIRSSTATAVKAEVFLYSGSPLMNGVSTGNYTYNNEFLIPAAQAAWEIIQKHRQGFYELEPWDTYKDMFWTEGTPNRTPGGPEIILAQPLWRTDNKYTNKGFQLTVQGRGSFYHSPTASYVDKFEMDNGYPIDDPASGYDPSNPWENRDPRFYYNIVIDREQIIFKNPTFAEFYIGGRDRGGRNSLTGFGLKKYNSENRVNQEDGYSHYYILVPHIRLAEIYLIYAEAVNEAYGPSGTAEGADLTAIDAVNLIRDRANMPPVPAKFTGDKDSFRERIRNERAVELAFEAKRWFDIRRWYVAHLPEYKAMDALNFDKDHTYFEKSVVFERVHDLKHYWMPFPPDQVSIYPGWQQNPGW